METVILNLFLLFVSENSIVCQVSGYYSPIMRNFVVQNAIYTAQVIFIYHILTICAYYTIIFFFVICVRIISILCNETVLHWLFSLNSFYCSSNCMQFHAMDDGVKISRNILL